MSSVRVVRDELGTFISVTFGGRRPHTRVLRVHAAVDAVAVRRVGGRYLGIFAATPEGRLLLWKESAGGFVQADAPSSLVPPRRSAAAMRSDLRAEAPAQLGDVRPSAALPLVSGPAVLTRVVAHLASDAASTGCPPAALTADRAPPEGT